MQQKKNKLRKLVSESIKLAHFSLNHAPDAIYWMGADGRFIYVNETACEMLGYSQAEMLNMGVADIDPALPDGVPAEMAQATKEAGFGRVETQHRSKDGRIIPVEVMVSNIKYKGKDLHCAFVRDIAGRKQSTLRLEESEEKYHKLLASAMDAIFLADVETGMIIEANQSASELIGRPVEDIIGMHQSELHPPGEISRYREIFEKHVKSGKAVATDVYVKHMNGRLIPVEIGASVVNVGGKSIIQGVFHDVTERQQAEKYQERLLAELKARNEELDNFTHTVSHDLKAPLLTINGFLGRLEGDICAGREDCVKDDVRRIKNATAKMKQLLEGLLKLSRIGCIINPVEDVDLHELATEVLVSFDDIISEKGVQVEISSRLPVVRADRARLLQVYENLLGNALKNFGSCNQPRIEIGLRMDQNQAVYFVKDNGIGIASSLHEKVFGLFVKLDASDEGTGVGLAICKRIIEAHGGRIWVESEGEGRGAAFCFVLPM